MRANGRHWLRPYPASRAAARSHVSRRDQPVLAGSQHWSVAVPETGRVTGSEIETEMPGVVLPGL